MLPQKRKASTMTRTIVRTIKGTRFGPAADWSRKVIIVNDKKQFTQEEETRWDNHSNFYLLLEAATRATLFERRNIYQMELDTKE